MLKNTIWPWKLGQGQTNVTPNYHYLISFAIYDISFLDVWEEMDVKKPHVIIFTILAAILDFGGFKQETFSRFCVSSTQMIWYIFWPICAKFHTLFHKWTIMSLIHLTIWRYGFLGNLHMLQDLNGADWFRDEVWV